MTSEVDATIPRDNEKVDKQEVRDNFLTIKNEITALQLRTGVPAAQVFFNIPDVQEIRRIALRCRPSYARDTAFSRVSIKSL